jgi:hypothetical protein
MDPLHLVEYMAWIPLVGSALGNLLGGFVSDLLVQTEDRSSHHHRYNNHNHEEEDTTQLDVSIDRYGELYYYYYYSSSYYYYYYDYYYHYYIVIEIYMYYIIC